MAAYWRVASYGYPNPFGDKNAQRSWKIFMSFVQNDSYQGVKDQWTSASGPDRLSAHAVESRKSSLEEFGLLYVFSGSDKIEITPGGRQLIAAADAQQKDEFTWVGINLLMRFPLQGPPRSRVTSNVASAFPIYNFLFSALCELQNYVWLEELIRVLGKVTTVDGARAALEQVRDLRSGAESFDDLEPMPDLRGAYYNSMNQVLNHIGLAGLILTSERGSSPYTLDRKDSLLSSASEIVRLAIGERSAASADDDCVISDQFINRMPTVPPFTTEAAYFRYLGAAVPDMAQSRLAVEESLPQVLFGQENVSVLTEKIHYTVQGQSIIGEVATLCRVSRGQRLILSHDSDWTYKVRGKERVEGGTVEVQIVRSKPISNPETILPYFMEDPNE
uniref:hypothetical protein n=1 Tax=Cryobacterium sp. TaxID=1926290 RepID=UPI0015997756|nr:hypothetical protein [Cryobacterium sp.]QJS06289.1 hypothetical protein [Cryobacterium sp.]